MKIDGKWFKVPCKHCKKNGKACSKCDGKGYTEVYIDECPECGGNCQVECDCTGGLGKKAADPDCIACGGDGEHTCPACKGIGYDLDRLDSHVRDFVLKNAED